MAKESGLGMSVAIDDSAGAPQTISNDITNLSWTMPSNVQDTTGVDKSAMERLLLLADLQFTLNGVFNDASNLSYSCSATTARSSPARSGAPRRSCTPGQTLAAEILYNDFSFTRAQEGSLIFTAPGSLSNGTVPAWTP